MGKNRKAFGLNLSNLSLYMGDQQNFLCPTERLEIHFPSVVERVVEKIKQNLLRIISGRYCYGSLYLELVLDFGVEHCKTLLFFFCFHEAWNVKNVHKGGSGSPHLHRYCLRFLANELVSRILSSGFLTIIGCQLSLLFNACSYLQDRAD